MKEAEELVGYIVTSVTGDPDCFHIDSTIDENGVLINLSVDESQAGRILGRKGCHAMAIRQILRALGLKNSARYNLKISIWKGDE